MMWMPGESHRGPLPTLSEREAAFRDELRAHVEKLAGEIGERNLVHYGKLVEAARYVEASFAAAGYEVAKQEYEVGGKTCANLEVEIVGAERPGEIVVVGAHYDSVVGSPGANDNATGTAALLTLARSFAAYRPARTLRFVAFVNEEPPYFQTSAMGSLVYAKRCRERGEKIVAMLSLETIGHYTDEAGSQQYPFPLSLVYPSTGNFLAFVGNCASRALVRRTIGTFRAEARFPSEGGALPGDVEGVGWSDQWSFWQQGYPGVMLTDTAVFRYPHYHTRRDTPDKVDYERLARVTTGIEGVVRELASGD
jgi:Zn-dependent M28 family amino/carboxypeptidase